MNPFELVAASKMSATEAADLWCDDKRLDRVVGRETCFIHGHRGTGKSMLFRVLQRDCQELLNPEKTPTFLAVNFAVRDSELLVEELKLFQSELQRHIISESQLSLEIAKQLFLIIHNHPDVIPTDKRESLIALVKARMMTAYRFSEAELPRVEGEEFARFVSDIIGIIENECQRIRQFVYKSLYGVSGAYDGPLFFYDTLLGPIADFFSDRLDVCLYFLIDDGDDLPESHTVILNSWIARRRKSAAFKVSTMYAYKTWRTRSGSAIQHTHDFIQYDIATRYLDGKGESYIDLLREICQKRLAQAKIVRADGTVVDPMSFFPTHEDQERRIQDVKERLTKEYAKVYSGRAIRDNVYRHTMSEYLRDLNRRRSLASFQYAGFRTLAILSGGLVRDFIMCAQQMFDNASRGSSGGGTIQCVPASIQNHAVRAHADRLLSQVGDSRRKRVRDDAVWPKVGRIVEGVGALFREKILSQDSERRVFSFALQTRPSKELERLLHLGTSEGYFMKGYIAKKEGTGRRALYVLTRRLAPCFSLDVSSYAGYLSCKPEVLEKLASGDASLRVSDLGSEQMELFETHEADSDGYGWADPDDVEVW